VTGAELREGSQSVSQGHNRVLGACTAVLSDPMNPCEDADLAQDSGRTQKLSATRKTNGSV
jgi:hypothetical protein